MNVKLPTLSALVLIASLVFFSRAATPSDDLQLDMTETIQRPHIKLDWRLQGLPVNRRAGNWFYVSAPGGEEKGTYYQVVDAKTGAIVPLKQPSFPVTYKVLSRHSRPEVVALTHDRCVFPYTNKNGNAYVSIAIADDHQTAVIECWMPSKFGGIDRTAPTYLAYSLSTGTPIAIIQTGQSMQVMGFASQREVLFLDHSERQFFVWSFNEINGFDQPIESKDPFDYDNLPICQLGFDCRKKFEFEFYQVRIYSDSSVVVKVRQNVNGLVLNPNWKDYLYNFRTNTDESSRLLQHDHQSILGSGRELLASYQFRWEKLPNYSAGRSKLLVNDQEALQTKGDHRTPIYFLKDLGLLSVLDIVKSDGHRPSDFVNLMSIDYQTLSPTSLTWQNLNRRLDENGTWGDTEEFIDSLGDLNSTWSAHTQADSFQSEHARERVMRFLNRPSAKGELASGPIEHLSRSSFDFKQDGQLRKFTISLQPFPRYYETLRRCWVPENLDLFLPASLCALNLRDSLDPNFAERKILLIKGGGDQYKANPHQQHRQACENRLCYELTDQKWTFEFANTNFELVVTYSYLTHQYSAELFYWQDQDKVVVPIRPE